MNRSQWWVDSGQAAEAAQSLVWFVVLVFAAIAVVLWRDVRKELNQSKEKQNGIK